MRTSVTEPAYLTGQFLLAVPGMSDPRFEHAVIAMCGHDADGALGIGLGAVQLIPLVELLPLNFRAGSTSFAQVLEWAWPTRHVLTFALPDIFGNPSHHRWFDLWDGVWRQAQTNANGQPVDTIFWGIKNYVEGGNYLGLATWLLAGVAVEGGDPATALTELANDVLPRVEALGDDLHPGAVVVTLPQRFALFLVGLEPDGAATAPELLPCVGESPAAAHVGDHDRLVEQIA